MSSDSYLAHRRLTRACEDSLVERTTPHKPGVTHKLMERITNMIQEDTIMPTPNRTAETIDHTDIASIREDLATLKSDFSSLMSDVASGGKHIAQRGAETISDTAHNAANQLKSAQDWTCNTVKDHPMASILVAAGVGAIAARLIFRGGR